MVDRIREQSKREYFMSLLQMRRMMPALTIEHEANIILSRVRHGLSNSRITEDSKSAIYNDASFIGPVKCHVGYKQFNELSLPENREILLAALAVEVERLGGDALNISVIRKSGLLSILSSKFDTAVILLPDVETANRLCRPYPYLPLQLG